MPSSVLKYEKIILSIYYYVTLLIFWKINHTYYNLSLNLFWSCPDFCGNFSLNIIIKLLLYIKKECIREKLLKAIFTKELKKCPGTFIVMKTLLEP